VQEVWDMIIVILVPVVGEALLMLKMQIGVSKWVIVMAAVVWQLLAVYLKMDGAILPKKQAVESQIHGGLTKSISDGSMNGSVGWDGKHIL